MCIYIYVCAMSHILVIRHFFALLSGWNLKVNSNLDCPKN